MNVQKRLDTTISIFNDEMIQDATMVEATIKNIDNTEENSQSQPILCNLCNLIWQSNCLEAVSLLLVESHPSQTQEMKQS